MSRIGKAPVANIDGVQVSVADNTVIVKGPKGELKQAINPAITVEVKDGEVNVTRSSDHKDHRALHGLTRALINNMVVGVTKGYKTEQELIGVGYRAANQGQLLDLSLGYSHNIILQIPEEVKITTASERGKAPVITLESIDKQLIGAVAAKIRSLRKPEPYKGKGIRFVGEHIRKKAGKTAG